MLNLRILDYISRLTVTELGASFLDVIYWGNSIEIEATERCYNSPILSRRGGVVVTMKLPLRHEAEIQYAFDFPKGGILFCDDAKVLYTLLVLHDNKSLSKVSKGTK